MNQDELRRLSDKSQSFALLAFGWLIGGLIGFAFIGAANVLLGIVALIATFVGFVLLQARSQHYWDQFIDGAATLLGDEDPLIQRGRRM